MAGINVYTECIIGECVFKKLQQQNYKYVDQQWWFWYLDIYADIFTKINENFWKITKNRKQVDISRYLFSYESYSKKSFHYETPCSEFWLYHRLLLKEFALPVILGFAYPPRISILFSTIPRITLSSSSLICSFDFPLFAFLLSFNNPSSLAVI